MAMNNTMEKFSTQLFLVGVIFVSMLCIGTSVGMNAVLFPVTMKENGNQHIMIGAILSLEMAAILLANFIVPKITGFFHTRTIMIISMLLRVVPLLLMPFLKHPLYWMILIIIHGMGMFTFQMQLLVWLNTIPLQKCRGLMLAMWGTALSIGLTVGPMIVETAESEAIKAIIYGMPYLHHMEEYFSLHVEGYVPFFISAIISLIAVVPIIVGWRFVPLLKKNQSIKTKNIIRRIPTVMATALLVGASIFGVQSFITLYGMMNSLDVYESLLLLSAFMFGGLTLEAPLAAVSDFFDRNKVLMLTAAIGLVCAVCLPIAIYSKFQSLLLLYVWGGVVASMFSICSAIISDRFKGDELIVANTTFFTMYVVGGSIGTFMIGGIMEFVQSDGLPYTIMIATVIYVTYCLTRYIAAMNHYEEKGVKA